MRSGDLIIEDLLELAEELVSREKGRPKQVSLRRAVSTAYYALFHAICIECADSLVGWNRHWRFVQPLYRSIDHGAARKIFEKFRKTVGGDDVLVDIGRIFIELRDARILANYEPEWKLGNRGDVMELVGRARRAVTSLRVLSDETRLDLAIQLVIKQRR